MERANIALQALSDDLGHTPAFAISYRPADSVESSVIGLCRREGVSAAGRPRFEKDVVVYFLDKSQGELRRRTWPPGPPAFPLTPEANRATTFEADDLLSFMSHPQSGRVLANHVAEFDALDTWPPGPVVTSRILLIEKVPGGKDARFEMQKRTAFRN